MKRKNSSPLEKLPLEEWCRLDVATSRNDEGSLKLHGYYQDQLAAIIIGESSGDRGLFFIHRIKLRRKNKRVGITEAGETVYLSTPEEAAEQAKKFIAGKLSFAAREFPKIG